MLPPPSDSPLPATSRRGRYLAVVAALLLIAGALRFLIAAAVFPPRLIKDERYYLEVASNIARGEGHLLSSGPTTWYSLRPPAHPYLMSLLRPSSPSLVGNDSAPDEATLRRQVYLQIALSTLVVFATVLLGWTLFGRRAGLLAGALATVYPTFLAFSHYLWSENLFALLVTLALTLLVYGARRPRWELSAVTGLLFGCAALTREVAIPVALGGAVWLVSTAHRKRRGSAALQSLVILATTAAVILPWSYRNWRIHGRLVPVSTVGWFAAAEGNSWGEDRLAFKRRFASIPGELEKADYARSYALDRIAAAQPLWLLRKLRNAVTLFSCDSYLLYKIRSDGYGEVPRGIAVSILAISSLFYLTLLFTGLLGGATDPSRRRQGLLVAVLAAVVAVSLLANASTRFRLPWMPLLMAYSSSLAVSWRSRLAVCSRTRIACSVALAGGFSLLCAVAGLRVNLSLW